MKKYKKYILFAYDTYYPAGALNDVKDSFDTFEEAETAANKDRSDYKDIVDRDTWEIVKEI